MSIEHTPECRDAIDQRNLEIATYVTDWPDYCRRCQGWGGSHSTYDPSPAGVALGPGTMDDFDTCPDCIDKGLCPRCGESLSTGASMVAILDAPPLLRCPACKWTDEETPGCPEPAECLCWVQDDGPPLDF